MAPEPDALRQTGREKRLAIRLDNPPNSSRWYPGGGIYRNVWLVKTAPVHVGQWGTYVTTPEVSAASATVNLKVTVDNDSKHNEVSVATEIFALDATASRPGRPWRNPGSGRPDRSGDSALTKARPPSPIRSCGGRIQPKAQPIRRGHHGAAGRQSRGFLRNAFGIRTLKFTPDEGFFLNGEHVKLNGVCDHHDLGALGSAVNYRALQRQLEMLADMGCNAIRTSHNPPAPELLELADKMGFLVMDEAFDCWLRARLRWITTCFTPTGMSRICAPWCAATAIIPP